MPDKIDWRKLPVRRDTKFEAIEEIFCSTKNNISKDSVFSTIKELMIFSALIGFQLDDFRPISLRATTTPILLETYASTQHDAYIYLIALAKEPSLDTLKDDKLKSAINIFEGYCNAGLHHIDNWVINNIGEPIIENVLFNKTLEFLVDNE